MQWFGMNLSVRNLLKKHIFSAIGDGESVIYINGEENMVVAITSTFKPLVFDRIRFIQEFIEPLAENVV